MIIKYLDYIERLEFELIQSRDEGLDVSIEQQLFADIQEELKNTSAENLQSEAKQVLQDLASRSVPSELTINEPDELQAIRRAIRPVENESILTSAGDSKSQYDSILGGWLGRAGGCLLGKPIERYHRTVIREMLKSNNEWPLDNYFTQTGMPKNLLEKYPWKRRGGFESLRENIQCMPEDDDLNYTMMNLYVMESHGTEFSSDDIGNAWMKKLPVFEVFTAERVGYQNLLNGYSPPQSASLMNPFREWIGAQIRADLWGYVNPGDPRKAAEYAWRDARVTHVRTGIYGEMFFAAVIAAAFVEKDIRKLMLIGLEQVPPESRFSKAIHFVLELPIENQPWEDVLDQLYHEFGHYHWVHTINNAALTVASLLYGAGDYEKTVTNAVMGGWDTDCNGATSGSILGVLNGAEALPSKWIDPLKNSVRSSLSGFDNSSFTDLARRTLSVAQTVKSENGGSTLVEIDDF
ncbi:MAG: ADP-ribosylglycohydrolase family protein [Candidatus Marinimicrobia bacterium]|nr:ADP-ribosylglycohydrolase family protein [Candidatus Neomarinimicrobiota bacterium]